MAPDLHGGPDDPSLSKGTLDRPPPRCLRQSSSWAPSWEQVVPRSSFRTCIKVLLKCRSRLRMKGQVEPGSLPLSRHPPYPNPVLHFPGKGSSPTLNCNIEESLSPVLTPRSTSNRSRLHPGEARDLSRWQSSRSVSGRHPRISGSPLPFPPPRNERFGRARNYSPLISDLDQRPIDPFTRCQFLNG